VLWVTAILALLPCNFLRAEIYKCAGPDGATSYSDIACETKPATTAAQSAARSPTTGAARDVPIVPAETVAPSSSLDRKLQELMTLTQLSARESAGSADVAQLLVPRLDSRLAAQTQDARWTALSRMIQADIGADMSQLGGPFSDANRTTLKSIEGQVQEPDADALLAFVHSPLGVSYLQFLDDMRAVYASALRSVVGHMESQTPIPQSSATPAVTQMRVRLITLATAAAPLYGAQDLAHNTRDPAPFAADGIRAAQVAAVAGTGLDAVGGRFGAALGDFEAFNTSVPAKRFFTAVSRPIAVKMAATDAAMNVFGDAELQKYGARWKLAYQRGTYLIAFAPRPGIVAGSSPQILQASYGSSRGGRSFDVTRTVDAVCPRGNVSCRVACGNQLAGDPDFGRVKFCQITFQCFGRPPQRVTEQEGRSVTLTCVP